MFREFRKNSAPPSLDLRENKGLGEEQDGWEGGWVGKDEV